MSNDDSSQHALRTESANEACTNPCMHSSHWFLFDKKNLCTTIQILFLASKQVIEMFLCSRSRNKGCHRRQNLDEKISNDYDHLFRITTYGDFQVGKTSLVERFVERKFSGSTLPTIGVDFRLCTILLDDQRVKAHL